MSARKRARKSLTQLFPHGGAAPSHSSTSLPVWHALLPEMLQHATTFLLSPWNVLTKPNIQLLDIQLLLRLSSVCSDWRRVVYGTHSSSGHVDLWTTIGTVRLMMVHYTNGCSSYQLVGRHFPYLADLLPGALTSLTPVHSLRLLFFAPQWWKAHDERHRSSSPELGDVASTLLQLSRYDRLTSVDIDLTYAIARQPDCPEKAELEEALNAALASFASAHHPLTSLVLQCADHQLRTRPAVDVLRRVCSSMKQLFLSVNELLLMAWGDGPSYNRVWKSHSVQSFVIWREAPSTYLNSDELVVTALAKSLHSLTHLHIFSDLSFRSSCAHRRVLVPSPSTSISPRHFFPPSCPSVARPPTMSSRKRARTPEPAHALTRHHNLRHRPSPPSRGGWHTILPELLFQSTTFLLGSCWRSNGINIQLLFRLSSVCSEWRGVINRGEGGSGHLSFWSRISTVTVTQKERNQKFYVSGCGWYHARVIPVVLASLQHVRALHLNFDTPRLSHVAVILDSLTLYTRLSSLLLNLNSVRFKLGRYVQQEAQDALDAALAALASRCPNHLTSLDIYCPPHIRPTSDTSLRRLCSSVLELSLSANEMLLMAWGSNPLYDRAWKARSVQSFVLPYLSPPDYLSNDLVVTTLVTTLPSLTHLRLDARQEPKGVLKLLQQVGRRLLFLACPTAVVSQLLSPTVSCSALTSLSFRHDGARTLSEAETTTIFASLTSLTELTLTDRSWRNRPIYLAPLPRLTYLHVDSQCVAVCGGQPLDSILTPNLTP